VAYFISMYFEVKNSIKKRLNAYFFFVALAFMAGAYVFILDSSVRYAVKTDLLVSAKSEEIALNFDKIRENIVILAEKSDILNEKIKTKIDPDNSFIEFEIEDITQSKVNEKSDILTRSFIDNTGKYYDAKTELSLELVHKQVFKKEAQHLVIFIKSLFIGLILSFIVQLFLELIEKIMINSLIKKNKQKREDNRGYRDLENVLKFNSEKIKKLSSDFSLAEKNLADKRDSFNLASKGDFRSEKFLQEIQPIFKKAASPINLPIAQEEVMAFTNDEKDAPVGVPFVDEETESNLEARVFGSITHSDYEEITEEKPINEVILKDTINQAEANLQESPKAFVEPTEEDFKRKLNQLLGNR